MSFHDTMPRSVTKSPLISLATLLYGLVWFAMSVIVIYFFIVTKRKSQASAREVPNTIVIVTPNSSENQPQSILVPRDTNYRVTFGDLPKGLQRRGRRDAPAMITVIPPESGSITFTTSAESPTISMSASMPPVSAPALLEQEATKEPPAAVESEQNAEASPDLEESSSFCPITRKPTLSMKFPKVFRRKSRRSSNGSEDSSRASTPRSLSPAQSPQQRLADLLPENGETRETIPLSQRKSYHRPDEDSEYIRTRFVNPLRFKPRRSLSGPRSGRNAPDQSPAPTPSAPPSSFTHHKRNRSLASMVSMAIRPHHRRTQSSSPHRCSFSSSSTISSTSGSSSSPSTSSSAASSKRSFTLNCGSSPSASASSERDVPRTQPYGAPYYAAMPVPRRGSATHPGVVVKQLEDDEGHEGETHARLVEMGTIRSEEGTVSESVDQLAVTGAGRETSGALGLALGNEPRTRPRSREVRGGSGAVR